MTTLLVGFDSAWTPANKGAIAAALRLSDGTFRELSRPVAADFGDAASLVASWRAGSKADRTIVMLDQPTIVPNASGQRPVEHLVGSPVSRRLGGVQPANTSKLAMFGPDAPIWPFLNVCGGPCDPTNPCGDTQVFETYPVLMMIALDWCVPDDRPGRRHLKCLPKYNPANRKKFKHDAWRHVCRCAADEFAAHGLTMSSLWLQSLAAQGSTVRKGDQDMLDASLCLITAMYYAGGRTCLMVGDTQTGYILVPAGASLHAELTDRCEATGRDSRQWVRSVVRHSS